MILFPESVSLFFRQKLKDDLSQKQNKKKKTKKKKKKYDIFQKCSEKMVFPKQVH